MSQLIPNGYADRDDQALLLIVRCPDKCRSVYLAPARWCRCRPGLGFDRLGLGTGRPVAGTRADGLRCDGLRCDGLGSDGLRCDGLSDEFMPTIPREESGDPDGGCGMLRDGSLGNGSLGDRSLGDGSLGDGAVGDGSVGDGSVGVGTGGVRQSGQPALAERPGLSLTGGREATIGGGGAIVVAGTTRSRPGGRVRCVRPRPIPAVDELSVLFGVPAVSGYGPALGERSASSDPSPFRTAT
ncbi:MAG: hypothetical protein QOH97_54 [Actinoplanes sp.]|jgi:hypothetical protein|nr:hypothetical protein [Actinoplanes sp.]